MRPPPKGEPIRPENHQGPVPAHLLPPGKKPALHPKLRLKAEIERAARAFFSPPPEPVAEPVTPEPAPPQVSTSATTAPSKRPLSEAQKRQLAERLEKRWEVHRAAERARRDEILALLGEGASVTEVMRRTGLTREAVGRLSEGRSFLCPCGRPASHKGACSDRYELTPARAAAAELAKERSGSPEARRAAAERARAWQATRTREERADAVRRAHAARSETLRRTIAKKAAATRVERQASLRSELSSRPLNGASTVRLTSGGVVAVRVAGVDEERIGSRERKLLIDLALLIERLRPRCPEDAA